MNPVLRKLIFAAGIAALVWVAHDQAGWQGVALVAGGIVMWLLLHFNRTMQVLKRAADRPIGYVESAVMLNAKLKPGVNLLHVMAMTRSMGEQVSPKDQQPEVFRWKDDSDSHVTCEFVNGRLAKWGLWRPPVSDVVADTPVTASESLPARTPASQ